MWSEALPYLAAVASILVSALVAGRAVGNVETKVAATEKSLTDLMVRFQAADNARFENAKEQGRQEQRLKTLEDHRPDVAREMAQLEARVKAEVKGVEERLIDHFDRSVSLITSTRKS